MTTFTLSQGQVGQAVYLSQGEYMTVTPSGQAQVSVADVNGSYIVSQMISSATTYGPYSIDARVSVYAVAGSVSYTDEKGIVTTSAQAAAGGVNAALLTEDGRILDSLGNQVTTSAARSTALGMWFTGLATNAQSALADRCSNVLLTNNNALVLSGANAIQFNASGFLQSDATLFTTLQRSIMNLSTVTTSDQIVVWMILTHPTTLGTFNLFYWGRNAVTGWGVTLNGAQGKLIFDHVPQGGTRDQYTMDTSFQLRGDNSLNTKTALCMTVTRAYGDQGTYGKGAGLFHVELAKYGLADQGPFGQKNFTVVYPQRIPNTGTAPCNYAADTGLTLGFRPTSAPTTGADVLSASYGMDNVGFFRTKRRHGLACKIVRELQAAYLVGQHQFTMPPSIAF